MCQSLNLNYNVLAKHNHKDLSVEYFHRFLNKSVIIATEDCGTNDIFVPAGITAGYAWNSALIPNIGKKTSFSFGLNLNVAPKVIQNNAQAIFEYLKLTDSNRHFSSSILKTDIEDRRTSHTERINSSRNLVVFQAGDIVMARTSIQSNLSKNKVAKISYSDRGPYQIVHHTGFGSYYVRKLHKPDSPELKFVAYDLYSLPPSLKPYEPVDTTDIRYLNQTDSPLANPLKRALHIELYDKRYFTKPVQTSAPPVTYKYDTHQRSKDTSLTFPSVSDLFK